MKFRISILIIALLLTGTLGISLPGCGNSNTKVPDFSGITSASSKSANGLSLTLSLDSTTYQPGQMVSIVVISSGCSVTNHDGFAIYLTKGDIRPAEMPSLSRVSIQDEPIIDIEDIIDYNSASHQITLTENASNRISNLSVPMDGKSFVVCVNKKPVYWGTFWSSFSSAVAPASRVIVSYPLSHRVQTGNAEGIQVNPNILELSYYGADDPRNDPEILNSFDRFGKLDTNH
jgi:hypothetical protein